jgi:hypothetical protein
LLQCESNAHQFEVAYSQLVMRASEEITAFAGRVEEMRRMFQFASVSKSDLSVKQSILKGLPAEYAPVPTSYLHGSDSSSPEGIFVLELLGRLRVFEASLDCSKVPQHAKGASQTNENGLRSYCGKSGHVARQWFKRKRDARNQKTPKSDSAENRAMHVAMHASAESGMHAWIVESGASSHMASDPCLFSEYRPMSDTVKYADGCAGVAEGIGTLSVILHGYAIALCDVLCAHSLSDNLFSVTAAAARGTQLVFYDTGCAFAFSDHESFQVQTDPRNGLALLVDTLKREPSVESWAMVAGHTCSTDLTDGEFSELWHKRFGH